MSNRSALWGLYLLQEKTGRAASEILRLGEWVERRYGLDGWWTCLQLDRCVTRFGLWVENRLLERDEQGRPRYTLEMLLAPPAGQSGLRSLMRRVSRDTVRAMFGQPGIIEVR